MLYKIDSKHFCPKWPFKEVTGRKLSEKHSSASVTPKYMGLTF